MKQRRFIRELDWSSERFIFESEKFNPDFGSTHALVPTPVVLGPNQVRIYCSFLDSEFVGRIGFVDLKFTKKQFEIDKISQKPFLDVGNSNHFSQSGTGLGCFYPPNKPEFLFYIGFNRNVDTKFKAFSALKSINSLSKVFISSENSYWKDLESTKTILGIHDVVFHEENYYGFVSVGDKFLTLNGALKPSYNIHIAVGKNLSDLKLNLKPMISQDKHKMYRMGRPRITKTGSQFEMLCTVGDLQGNYFPKVYYSKNFFDWEEEILGNFSDFPIKFFDDEQQCYLSRFVMNDKEFVVYNGNKMGVKGFIVAHGK